MPTYKHTYCIITYVCTYSTYIYSIVIYTTDASTNGAFAFGVAWCCDGVVGEPVRQSASDLFTVCGGCVKCSACLYISAYARVPMQPVRPSVRPVTPWCTSHPAFVAVQLFRFVYSTLYMCLPHGYACA